MNNFRGLEIGGGSHPRAYHTYEQFDLHSWTELEDYAAFHQGDARDLSRFNDETFDAVLSCQTLEHFSWRETPDILKEWFRVLKVGGTMTLELPDILGMYKDWQERTTTWTSFIERVFGSQDYEGNTHYTMFTKSTFPEYVRSILPNIDIVYIVSIANDGGFRIEIQKVRV